MKKTEQVGGPPSPDPDTTTGNPCYLAWFDHFNAGEYYEAHEVLETLWLRTSGGDRDFFKGLIQIAGAFVHLRKQRERRLGSPAPSRLPPAARLFLRGCEHLAPYGPRHLRLDVAGVCSLCESLARAIEASGYAENPWDPSQPPHITLAA